MTTVLPVTFSALILLLLLSLNAIVEHFTSERLGMAAVTYLCELQEAVRSTASCLTLIVAI